MDEETSGTAIESQANHQSLARCVHLLAIQTWEILANHAHLTPNVKSLDLKIQLALETTEGVCRDPLAVSHCNNAVQWGSITPGGDGQTLGDLWGVRNGTDTADVGLPLYVDTSVSPPTIQLIYNASCRNSPPSNGSLSQNDCMAESTPSEAQWTALLAAPPIKVKSQVVKNFEKQRDRNGIPS